MLTQQHKAEAQKKLKLMQQEVAQQEELKSKVERSRKGFNQAIAALAADPKAQFDLLKNLANTILPDRIVLLDTTYGGLIDIQDKMKNEKEKFGKEALTLFEDKQRVEAGIEEIKRTIINIQKTVKQSVDEQVKKRKKIEDDLEKSLDDIRAKITEFQTESVAFDTENAQLRTKIDALKEKLGGIEASFKVKAQEKDEQVRKEKEELTQKLKILEVQVQKATQLNKEFSAIQKKNFDHKLSLYLRTKKFPQFSSSFESSAKTLDSCKEQLLKGVTRLNIASETIQKCEREITDNNNQFLGQLKRQTEREKKLEDIKKEKEKVRGRIIELQNKIKEKKAQAAS